MPHLLGCVLCGYANFHRRQLHAQLRDVTVDDGISQPEAEVIAQSYFLRFGPGCGAAAPITDGGEFWISSTRIGVAAVPTREPIRIHKQSGRVTWSDGPMIKNSKAIW